MKLHKVKKTCCSLQNTNKQKTLVQKYQAMKHKKDKASVEQFYMNLATGYNLALFPNS